MEVLVAIRSIKLKLYLYMAKNEYFYLSEGKDGHQDD